MFKLLLAVITLSAGASWGQTYEELQARARADQKHEAAVRLQAHNLQVTYLRNKLWNHLKNKNGLGDLKNVKRLRSSIPEFLVYDSETNRGGDACKLRWVIRNLQLNTEPAIAVMVKGTCLTGSAHPRQYDLEFDWAADYRVEDQSISMEKVQQFIHRGGKWGRTWNFMEALGDWSLAPNYSEAFDEAVNTLVR